MKKLLYLFCFILFAYGAKAQEKQAILKVLETQRLAWNQGDVNAYMQGYWHSDSLVFVGKNGA
jgi:hypothetical protein